jgi:hypothetical protein
MNGELEMPAIKLDVMGESFAVSSAIRSHPR